MNQIAQRPTKHDHREDPTAALHVVPKRKMPDNEYAFGCTLSAAIRVRATSREEAEAHIRSVMDSADCNGGAWPNGEAVLFEASVNNSRLSLFEVNREPVEDGKATESKVSHRPLSETPDVALMLNKAIELRLLPRDVVFDAEKHEALNSFARWVLSAAHD